MGLLYRIQKGKLKDYVCEIQVNEALHYGYAYQYFYNGLM